MTSNKRETARTVANRWDGIFQALAAEPRRQLIVSLVDETEGEGVPLPESAMNPEIPVDFDELRATLYHHHLPLLADEQLVTWESDPFVAYRGPRFDEAALVIQLIQSDPEQIPDSLVIGCRRLEQKRQEQQDT